MAQVAPVKYSCTEIQYELEGTTPSLHESFRVPILYIIQYSFCETEACVPSYLLPTCLPTILHLHNAIIVNIII